MTNCSSWQAGRRLARLKQSWWQPSAWQADGSLRNIPEGATPPTAYLPKQFASAMSCAVPAAALASRPAAFRVLPATYTTAVCLSTTEEPRPPACQQLNYLPAGVAIMAPSRHLFFFATALSVYSI